MTATLSPPSWNSTAPVTAAPPWRFGHEVEGARGGRAGAALRWELKRNCSITPRQLGAVYLSLCGVAFVISAGFWWHGAPFVTAFAGIELLLVGVALLVYARHAGDREVLTLDGRSLHVECSHGSRVQTAVFAAEWLAVEPAAGQGSLVELSAQGQSVRVGRFVRPELRGALAHELRRAVRRAGRPEQDMNRN